MDNALYAEDLAYIHDAGFSHHARGTAAGLLRVLSQGGLNNGRIVELGCGGGVTARHLTQAGYDVLGVDQSAELLRLARQRVPQAKFRRASIFDFEIPTAAAVLSMGECLGYRPGRRGGTGPMMTVLKRAHRALPAGGMLIFDLVTPRVPAQATFIRQGDDWFLVSENTRESAGAWLRRDITTFRQVGRNYRRSFEQHHVQLYDATLLADRLRRIGFAVRVRRSIDGYALAPGRALFLARKR
ncbi:MAG: methyltransferase domain-containing protein [Acidobacteria bacterium]|nr:methyltransferase domain-containing protein [Acidobacteriota bacterium]